MRPKSRSLLYVIALVIAAGAPNGTATAGEGVIPGSPNELHCAYMLQPVGPGDTPGVIAAVPSLMGCYESASEAIFVGTGGAVRVPERFAGEALTQEVLDAYGAESASQFLIGREYNNTNFINLLAEYFASAACTNSRGWQIAYVGDGHNDKFESGRGFSNCDWNYKYEHADFRGARRECSPNCSSYQALRNQVSSLKYLGFRLG
jgi:hypothetical protein